jgi:hypothetical protein
MRLSFVGRNLAPLLVQHPWGVAGHETGGIYSRHFAIYGSGRQCPAEGAGRMLRILLAHATRVRRDLGAAQGVALCHPYPARPWSIRGLQGKACPWHKNGNNND